MPRTNEDIFKIPKPTGLLAGGAQNSLLAPPAPPVKTTELNKDWDKGDLQVTDDGVFFTPPTVAGPTAPGPATVEGRMAGLLSSGSPYIEGARTRAQNVLGRRGLLNTTMAGTAGELAAFETAFPIASQDAGYFQQRGLLELGGEIETGLERTRGEVQTGLERTRGEIQTGLQAQQGEIQTGLYETQGDISARLSEQGFGYDMALKQADIEWSELDLAARMEVEFRRLDEDNKTRFNETVNAIHESHNQDYMEILANPDWATPEDRQEAIRILSENTRARFDNAAAIAQVELTWTPPGTGASPKLDKVGEAARELDLVEKIKEALRKAGPGDIGTPGL